MSCTQKRTKGGAVKFLFTALLFLVSIGGAFGQVSAYTFGSASGTWTPVGAGGTRNTTLEADDASSALTIPFTFNFNGTDYTQITPSSNGFAVMGSALTNNNANYAYIGFSNSNGLAISSAGTGPITNAIVPFSFDGNVVSTYTFFGTRTSGSTTITAAAGANFTAARVRPGMRITGTGIPTGTYILSVDIAGRSLVMSTIATSNGVATNLTTGNGFVSRTTGTFPNRVFTLQWTGYKRYNVNDTVDYQIQLFEGTNVIKVVYNFLSTPTAAIAGTNDLGQVGLKGASNADFNNRTTTTDWAATTAGGANTATMTLSNTVKPASGLTYTWTPPPCARSGPTLSTVSSITSSGAALTWNAPASAPAFGYEWKIVAAGAGSGGTAVDSGTTVAGNRTATASGLSATTGYDLFVRGVCSPGVYSPWFGPRNFTTACASITTFPWNEGFEGLATVSTTIFPACWLEVTGVTNWRSQDASTTTYNDPRTGSKYIGCIFSGTSDNIWTPGFQLTAGTSYDFSTYFVGDGYSGWTGNIVYNTAQSPIGQTALGAAFIASTTTSTSGTNYAQILRSFTPLTTGTYYFGVIISSSGVPYSSMSFDDFKVDLTPACPNLPTALTSSAVLGSTATISWTAASPAPGSGYEYYYSSSATAPTGSTTPSGSTAAGIVTANISSLSPNTPYYFWVRSNCNGTDKSPWVGSATFTTACTPVAITQSQGFNAGTIPSCWKDVLVTSVSTNPTITYVTSGTNPTTTTAQEGTNMVMFGSYTGGTSGGQRRLVSLPLSTTGTSSVDVEFQWRNENNTSYNTGAYLNEGVQVQYSLDNATWVNAGSFIPRHDGSLASGAAAWNLKTVTLPGAAGNASLVYVGFLFRAQAGDNCFLDAAVIKPSPSCTTPTASSATGVTSNSATANWTGGTGSYIIEYGLSGFTPGTGATAGAGGTVITALAGATSATISGLSANTTYQFYVRQVCSGPAYSANTSVQSFTTLCAPISTFPWNEGFEGIATVSTTTFPSCWLEGTGTAWTSMDASTSFYNDARTGSKYIGCFYGSNNNRIWTPGFQLTAGTSYDFSTYFVGDGYTSWVGDVLYNTAQSATGETTLGASFITATTTSTSGITYTQVVRTFIPPTTGTYYFGIRVSSTSAPYSHLGFDDFKLDVTPSCAGAVGGTAVASSSCVSAYNGTVTITASGFSAGPGSTYQWQSSNDNFVTNIVDISGATTPNSYTTTGFTTSGTTYYRLKATCTSGTATAYSNILTVVANIATYATLPYTQSFESTWVTSCATNDRPDASWSNTNTSGDVDASWRRDDDGASGGWGNITSYMYSPAGTDGSRSARFHSGNTTAGYQSWMDLYVDLSVAGNKQLSFDVNDVNGIDALDVLVSTDGGVTFPTTLLVDSRA